MPEPLFTTADLAEFRGDAVASLRETCAIKRASDNWTATVATTPCHVGSLGGGATVINPLSDDPVSTIWVPVTVSAVLTDRLVVAGGATYEVVVIPSHGSDDVLRGLGCVELRAEGVPA